jgi:threonine aldolase
VTPLQTNLVVAALEGRSAPEVVSSLAAHGVLASAMDARTLRLVTHHDVSTGACERAAQALAAVLS